MSSASVGRIVAAAAMAACLASPRAALAQSTDSEIDDRWHFFVAPYLWGSGLEGTVGLTGVISVPVDLSFGDVLDGLDFAFLGRFEGRKNRIGFGLDVSYMNLGTDVVGQVFGRFGLAADVQSLTVEGIATWRVVNDETKGSYVDVLGGARYMKNTAGLTVERDGAAIAATERSLDWVDALVGARFRLGLGEWAGIHGRADIAGLGSDLTFNVQGGLEATFAEHWSVGAGYRYLDVDYDKGEALARRVWDVTYQGPYAFVGYGW